MLKLGSDLSDLQLLAQPAMRDALHALAGGLSPEFIREQQARLDRLTESRAATTTLPNPKHSS